MLIMEPLCMVANPTLSLCDKSGLTLKYLPTMSAEDLPSGKVPE